MKYSFYVSGRSDGTQKRGSTGGPSASLGFYMQEDEFDSAVVISRAIKAMMQQSPIFVAWMRFSSLERLEWNWISVENFARADFATLQQLRSDLASEYVRSS
ncbi:hypothetical protein OPV22_000639 [Ensete ventricosum]|uniref:Uncharacterized protein n=1 Tax=Ensete ventricosum TaxID=4639 RepID=A0AAV8RUZ4_ENSVE|nr:hypothetical protein OPV22_000639 [Ensete ventricosum]